MEIPVILNPKQIGKASGTKFSKLSFDYYDQRRQGINNKNQVVSKSQSLNIPDVMGFTTGDVIYEDYSPKGGGIKSLGRKVSIDLIVSGGQNKRYVLFHNTLSNGKVNNLLLST
jgi:hypothetical protein